MYTPTHQRDAPPVPAPGIATGTSPAAPNQPPLLRPPSLPGAAGGPVLTTSTGVSFVPGPETSGLIEQAAAAVPAAVTGQGGLWTTVGGHAGPGYIEIQGVPTGVVEALALPGVLESLHGADAIVLNLCYALAAGQGVPSVAEQFAALGKPVLATDQQVIVAGEEVISGKIEFDHNGVPSVVRDGTWKVLQGGSVRDLKTSSLLEAYDKLGLTPLPAQPAPAEPVAFASASPSPMNGGQASRLVEQMEELAAAAVRAGLLDEVDAALVASVRADFQRLLSHPQSGPAGTPDAGRAGIVARLHRLNSVNEVLRSQAAVNRSRQLTEEYVRAVGEAAPPQTPAEGIASEQAATAASYITSLAELAPQLRALRDAAAPDNKDLALPSNISELLDAALERARGAVTAARAARKNKDEAFRASVEASLDHELGNLITQLAGAEVIPDRAIRASEVVASARVDAGLAARLSPAQVSALDNLGYATVSLPPSAAGLAESFYGSLMAIAGPALKAALRGGKPTAKQLRRRIADEFDGKNVRQYQRLLGGASTTGQVQAQVRAGRDLGQPDRGPDPARGGGRFRPRPSGDGRARPGS